MRLRIPQIIFKAENDGYNLNNVYAKCREYSDSYSACVILIESSEGAIFGALIDTMPTCRSSIQFVGTPDSFVFTLHPMVNKYPSTHKNSQIALFAADYFTIGMEGGGPALRIDDKLKIGRTYQSDTFDNEPLTQTEGSTANDFKIIKFEILKL